ncbi:hypothetical protein EY643_13335 [Halioglobus maricola]|uniref:Uncharacterized protein n=1 Tax=Halioglobus maricola TaxID=2601894 RepID=A0A5P9NL48_9GAMM|nr:hypothetical protein [Halioglobus maricola]QFU76560.1 hypothetical protein EY643_13335 [Halioglobus maricola]
MEMRYNIYFAGEVLPGHDPDRVRLAVGQLFKANEATLNKLFNGRLQVVKRSCDKATALKYKQAMEKVGARPVIKTADPADSAPVTKTEPTPAPAAATPAEKPLSAAERIAALAAAPDVPSSAEPAPAAESEGPADSSGVSVAPPQSDVLRPEERQRVAERDIDTGDLAVDESATRLADPSPAPPPAPDVTHLSMGDTGEDIPTLPSDTTPLNPNTDAIDLSPEGTDFSDCAAPDAPDPQLDLSAIDLAPEGSDVLAEEFRKKAPAQSPKTDHIALED